MAHRTQAHRHWSAFGDAGTIKLGYRPDARPFSFGAEGEQPAGYAVALCTLVADQIKTALGRSDLALEWVPLEPGDWLRPVEDGAVDLVCSATPETLSARERVSFSIPIFPSGTGALLSANAPLALREILEHGQPTSRPIWRGSPARTVLERTTFSAITGTTSEAWLKERIATFQLDATVALVQTAEEGVQSILDGTSNVVFGDFPVLLDAAARSEASGNLVVLDRHFTYEPLALAMRRGDEEFRLAVDRALSGLYRSEDFRGFFMEWFGPPDETIVTFFRQTALPE